MENQPINLLQPIEPFLLPKQPPKKKRTALYFFIILIIALITSCGLRRLTLAKWPKEPEAYDQTTLRPKNLGLFKTVKNYIFHSGQILEGQENDRINILVLGIGGAGHDGPYLSDTNIIISLKPSAKELAVISVPRDLAADIPGHGSRKINSADSFGEAESPGSGGEYARKIFEKTFDLDIPYYVRVDFAAFEELIDEVGGIAVNVPRAFTDQSFPGPNFSYQTLRFDAGLQTMDGARALNFSRSRHGDNGEGSDFARARRQQLVIMALKEKLFSFGTYSNPAVIQKMINSVSSHVITNLDFGQIMYLASIAKDIQGNSRALVLDNSPSGYLVSTTGESGAFLLSPKTGNFDTINLAIKNIFETASETVSTPVIAPENKPLLPTAKVELQNGTWRAGLASRIKKYLEEKGISVLSIGNSLKRPIEKTVIYLINPNANKDALYTIAHQLKAESTTALPAWLKESYDNPATTDDEAGMKYNKDADILVILGDDTKE